MIRMIRMTRSKRNVSILTEDLLVLHPRESNSRSHILQTLQGRVSRGVIGKNYVVKIFLRTGISKEKYVAFMFQITRPVPTRSWPIISMWGVKEKG